MIGLMVLVVIVAIIVIAVRQRAAASSLSSAPVLGRARPGAGNGALVRRTRLEDKLDSWVAADLIDPSQADAVLAYEKEHAPGKPGRVPLVAEAVGYIGSGLVLASAALLVGNTWEDMSTPARIVSLAVPTIVAAAAGWWTGSSDEPALERLGSVLWALAVAGVAGLAAEVWVDAIHGGDPPVHHTTLFIGSITLVAAATAWWIRRSELQQLALLAASIATALGIVDTITAGAGRDMSLLAGGLTLMALGSGWVVASLAERLPPQLLANLSGSALILVGAQLMGEDNIHATLWLGLAAAIGLLAVGVVRSKLEILLVGTVGLFVWTPQIALYYLEETFGAEATLFIIGTLLIGLAGGFTKIYPRVRQRNEDPVKGLVSH